MIHIALYQPEIPPNTGNIIRLCANAQLPLHLIKPYPFSLDEKACRRAGMDYIQQVAINEYDDYPAFTQAQHGLRILACTTKASQLYTDINFREPSILLFGPESRGLPDGILASLPEQQKIRIPMQAHSRSLNLSNAVAIISYEALRQLGFPNCH